MKTLILAFLLTASFVNEADARLRDSLLYISEEVIYGSTKYTGTWHLIGEFTLVNLSSDSAWFDLVGDSSNAPLIPPMDSVLLKFDLNTYDNVYHKPAWNFEFGGIFRTRNRRVTGTTIFVYPKEENRVVDSRFESLVTANSSIEVFDLNGRKVATDPTQLASGLYFVMHGSRTQALRILR